MKKFFVGALAIFPSVIFAHPGHGTTDGYTITHYFTETPHVLVSLSVMTVAVLIVKLLRDRKKQRV